MFLFFLKENLIEMVLLASKGKQKILKIIDLYKKQYFFLKKKISKIFRSK